VQRPMTVRVLNRIRGVLPTVVAYAYKNARPQFQPALYVVLYAGIFIPVFAALLWAISCVMSPPMSVNWEVLLGGFVGPLAVGELVRGHVRLWLHRSSGNWSAMASAAGGAAAGLTVWGLRVAKWGADGWSEPLKLAAFGAVSFLVLGWLIQYQARQAAASR
jgi:hypothetical protein